MFFLKWDKTRSKLFEQPAVPVFKEKLGFSYPSIFKDIYYSDSRSYNQLKTSASTPALRKWASSFVNYLTPSISTFSTSSGRTFSSEKPGDGTLFRALGNNATSIIQDLYIPESHQQFQYTEPRPQQTHINPIRADMPSSYFQKVLFGVNPDPFRAPDRIHCTRSKTPEKLKNKKNSFVLPSSPIFSLEKHLSVVPCINSSSLTQLPEEKTQYSPLCCHKLPFSQQAPDLNPQNHNYSEFSGVQTPNPRSFINSTSQDSGNKIRFQNSPSMQFMNVVSLEHPMIQHPNNNSISLPGPEFSPTQSSSSCSTSLSICD